MDHGTMDHRTMGPWDHRTIGRQRTDDRGRRTEGGGFQTTLCRAMLGASGFAEASDFTRFGRDEPARQVRPRMRRGAPTFAKASVFARLRRDEPARQVRRRMAGGLDGCFFHHRDHYNRTREKVLCHHDIKTHFICHGDIKNESGSGGQGRTTDDGRRMTDLSIG
jgi:site-specific DNA-cytosine methylase